MPLTNADVEIVEAVEGQPLRFKATVQVRPEVTLGDYQNFSVRARDRDRRRRQGRQGRRGAARPERHPARRSRTAARRTATGRSSGSAGTRDGVAVRGRHVRADAADHRRGPPDPGLRGATSSASSRARPPPSTSRSPTTTRRRASPASRPTSRWTSRSCARRSCPPRTTTSRSSMGDYADLAALKADIDERLRRNALDRARHEFSDKIIEYAVANATLELPDILVDQEVEVMHDEFRSHARPAGDRASRPTSRPPARPRRTSTRSSARAPSSAPRCCSCCPRSRTRRA